MTLRFACLGLALLTLTGCSDILRKLTKKGDAGTTTVASADPPPAPTTTDDDDAPPSTQPTNAPAPAKPKTAAAASPAELEKAFAALDINDDNQLDGIEVKSCGCAVADANGDGEITKAEYLAAGLLGKFRPSKSVSVSPSPSPSPAPTPTQQTPPPAPVAEGGLPPGTYRCSALVGGILSTMGTLKIIDGTRYSAGDGSGAGNYSFDPASKQIRFTSGMYAAPDTVKSARQISDTKIQLRQGKSGFTVTDCKR